MKKLSLVLCFMFFANVTFAATGGESQIVYSVNLRNNTQTYADYLIPVTTIRPNVDKLWGFDCVTLAGQGNPETWISIFDSTSSVMSGECYGEWEANARESLHDRWVRGRKVLNGIAVRVGAFTETQIYFIRE